MQCLQRTSSHKRWTHLLGQILSNLSNGFAFQGAIERLDMTAQTLVIKGTTIWWGRPQPQELAVLPAGSKLSELAVGRQIRVRAVNANSRLEATLINLQ